MFQWLHSHGCPWNEGTCEAAARSGQLELLQWLHSEGCPWDEWTFYSALKTGNLKILKWLHGNGCPLPSDTDTFSLGASHGNLEVLK